MRAILAQSKSIKLESQNRICLSDTRNNWRSLLSRSGEFPELREGMLILIDYLVGKTDCEGAMRECLKSPVTDEPWMLDIIRFGGELLGDSITITKKIQNYNTHGVFCFYQSYWNENDILLGDIASLRNRLIKWMVEIAKWKIISMPVSSCRLPVRHGLSDETTFFKGHTITLNKTSINDNPSAIACRFEYDKLVISEESEGTRVNLSIAYSRNGKICDFYEKLKEKAPTANESFRSILCELSQACEELTVQDGLNESGNPSSVTTGAILQEGS